MNKKIDLPEWQALFHIPTTTQSLLDIGCNVGELLNVAQKRGIKKLTGIDINKHAIEKALVHYSEDTSYHFSHASADTLQFEDKSFDAITICEVIEHVPSKLRPKMIAEMARCLVDHGTVVLTTPHRGLFHWLDPANMRLRFPSLFKFLSKTVGGHGREHGFVGEKHDIVWHHHFTLKELEDLLSPHFEITYTRMRGCLIEPIAQYLLFPFYRKENYSSPIYKLIRTIKDLENSFNLPTFLGFDVLLVLKKKANA